MKLTGWIAVAGWLIISPVFAQSTPAVPAPIFSEPTTEIVASPLTVSPALDSELELLRKDIAAIKKIREQVAAESNQPLTGESAGAQERRRELLELLAKLAVKKIPTKPLPEVVAPEAPPPASNHGVSKSVAKPAANGSHPLITERIVDPYALGRALFRTGDFIGAEQAFRKVKVTDDNRVLLQYLIATCLRKQSHWEQAAKAFRIVSENKEDPVLRDLALWQLENIRWYQQTESQLEQLRQVRESPSTAKGSPQASGRTTSPR